MSLESHAEVLKLARLLGQEPQRFEFLESVDSAELRQLREQATGVLFDAHAGVLRRMANASRLLPAPVLAKIAQRVFGPTLCARIAGLVEVSRGVDVAKRLPPDFLADVAAELDPRRAAGIIAGVPAGTVNEVAAELVRRADWITIGRFAGSLPDRAMSAALEVLDDSALLRVAFVLDDKSELDHLIGLLPSDRIDGLARSAAEHDLWDAAFDLIGHLSAGHRQRLADAAATLDGDARARAVARARQLGITGRLGPLLDALE